MPISSNIKKTLFLIVVSLSLGYIVWNSPLAVDDLYYEAYDLQKIGDIFHFAIAYGNGRLLGNMLIHFILRSQLFRTLFQTSVIVILWLLAYKTAQTTNVCSFFACIALFLTISPSIFRDTYLWSSAFANYVPGIIFMFLSLYLVRKSSEIRHNIYIYILIAVISFAGQFFVEHTSLINIVFAFCILCHYVKTKEPKQKLTAASIWLGSAIIGMIFMLMIPNLFCITNEFENYQKVNVRSLHDLLISIIANGMQIAGLYLQNVFALLLITVVLITLTKPKLAAKWILLFVPIYGFVVNFIINDLWTGTVCGMVSLLLLVIYVITVVIVIVQSNVIKNKERILFLAGMSVFSVLPLLVVYPIGARCLLHSYVFLVLMALSLIENLAFVDLKFSKRMIPLCTVTVCLLLCFLTVHFHHARIMDQTRLEYVQDEVDAGADTITVPQIPSIYVKDNNGWSYGQIFYHNKKQDITFEFIDYHTWTALINR